jgi:hypothetical protein
VKRFLIPRVAHCGSGHRARPGHDVKRPYSLLLPLVTEHGSYAHTNLSFGNLRKINPRYQNQIHSPQENLLEKKNTRFEDRA